MSKIAHYLQEHLLGEVTENADIRRHLSHDASVLHLAPAIVVYPRGEEDIRKTVRFCWQLAERGRKLPVTARGAGSDTSGAAIGKGIMLLFTAHMDRILELDPKKKTTVVEPGITYDKLEQTLYTHGLFLPAYPSSASFATIGGGLANNVVGEKSVKYGGTDRFVRSLRVVLANGEVIETGRLTKRELSRKMGLSTFEGQVYRALDALLEDHAELIHGHRINVRSRHHNAGYNLSAVKSKEAFDLTPLFLGSQGTLGIITEASLSLANHHPDTCLIHFCVNKLSDLAVILPKILALEPSICDLVNKSTFDEVAKLNPRQLGNLELPSGDIHLFIEFEGPNREKQLKKLQKLAEDSDSAYISASDYDDQMRIWKARDSVATLFNHPDGPRKAVPVAEDVCVPVDQLPAFLEQAQTIFTAASQPPAMWGQAGSGIVRFHPLLDLANLGDRQKFFKLSESLYRLAVALGGSMSAGAGTGRIRAPYIQSIYGDEYYQLLLKVKAIFDPHNFLNPGVNTSSIDEVKAMMRDSYSLAHRHEHLPRS